MADKPRPKKRLLGAALLSAATTGCAMTPDPMQPLLIDNLSQQETYLGAVSNEAGQPQMLSWWSSTGGSELDDLVAVLRAQSFILKEANLQAEQALQSAKIARGQRLPSLTALGDVSTVRGPDFAGDFSWSEAYSAGLIFDFNADIFGAFRATERSAKLNALASQLSVQATEQREIAILAKNWVSAITLQKRLNLAERTAESFRSTYELTDQRYTGGSTTASASDVQIALQNLDTALSDIPQIETDLTNQLLILDEQLARSPGQTEETFKGGVELLSPISLPIGRPANLLANRPDVAASELRYLAALEDVGAARANLYPALSLSASLTFQADTPGEIFDWDEYIASLANSITAPVFQGGRLKAQIQIEQARATELATAFARTMLAAVIDVEIALSDLDGLKRQRILLHNAFDTARVSNELAQGRYRQGLASILSVLETQRSLDLAEQNLILADQAIANAHIDLFLSLGGEWTAQDETAFAQSSPEFDGKGAR
ncbi:MAG: TolC family protein [Pseudomonadota bacterium]